MKKLSMCVLSLVAFNTFAGTAIIPEWRQHSSVQSCFNVSNISESDVGVTIKLFKQDGTLFTGATTYGGGINTEFTLGAKKTIEMCVPAAATNFIGFGSISGRALSADIASNFLVARGVISDVSAHNKWQTVTINGGKPF